MITENCVLLITTNRKHKKEEEEEEEEEKKKKRGPTYKWKTHMKFITEDESGI
jgi:hypothetical protein